MPKSSSAAKTAAKPTKKPAASGSKIQTGYKPTEKEPYMNDKQLAYFRDKLLAWKKELLSESTETLGHLKEEK